ncbi:flagellar basal body rod protein FlgC [Vibrio sp. D431a]|uniref:flagellar basal body rod protein FlgC n=1 Tax=Vibrio sp. D431a TaxID=2837388 RepID=UPI002554467F|nr:flagellar basal body rod protein FlgC [Vibrio sp. D431a]MDK9793906.1 flagellar basal body rod protein FlgC [Vibrio sp. D431a]
MSLIDSMNATGIAMMAQGQRLNAISSNIANLDTVASTPEDAFKAKLVKFESVNIGGSQGVVVTNIVESKAAAQPIFAPNNPYADENGYLYGSNVNREEQVADMISAEKSYQLNAQMTSSLKSLALKTIQTISK